MKVAIAYDFPSRRFGFAVLAALSGWLGLLEPSSARRFLPLCACWASALACSLASCSFSLFLTSLLSLCHTLASSNLRRNRGAAPNRPLGT